MGLMIVDKTKTVGNDDPPCKIDEISLIRQTDSTMRQFDHNRLAGG